MTQARSLLLALGMLCLASGSKAEVAYQFQGTVQYVTDGTGGLLNLTGTFQIRDTFILSCTIDPATLDTSDPTQSACTGCVTAWSISVDGYTGTMRSDGLSILNVLNDVDEGGTICAGPDPADEFIVVATGFNAAPVGNAVLFSSGFGLVDCEGSAWSSSDVPRSVTVSELESGEMTLTFLDGSVTGAVIATLNQATVPVRPATWGEVKTRYR